MSADRTQPQTDQERQHSQELSLTRSRPPAEVPGYEAQTFLGAGAYGEVWVALDQNTGRHVAIKFYTHRGGLDWSLLSREVEKLVFLSADRYVVQLLDVGWDADPPYYVMEYIEQGSLDEYLQQHGPLPVSEAVELFREVATGLMHAHGKGVLHCDLKPANILLDQDHKPRLADFGQSRLSHEQRPALGTLFYMAPEQADLEALPDARWDVYALGALLYCILTGEPPYRHETAIAEIDTASNLSERLSRYRRLIHSSPPPTTHRRVPRIDRALVQIIDRALAANPKDRFANVQEVLDALASREKARYRLPLLVLGLVGPAILLLVMTLFGWRAYARAVGDSDTVVTQRTKESNHFAAQFVAGMVAREIDRYFHAVQEVAEDRSLQSTWTAALDDPALNDLLAQCGHPNGEGARQAAARQELTAHPGRQRLQRQIEELLNSHFHPPAASWFATDPSGTQLAIAFRGTPEQSTLGQNYGWRTYFHGGEGDRPRSWRPGPEDHITRAHLSAAFFSTATNTWKVAVSAPVATGEGRFLGVVALTVEVGKFLRFQGTPQQFAVLVDGREGVQQGVILQHPLFDELLERQSQLPRQLSAYRVQLEGIDDRKIYTDPLGKDPAGTAYDRRWIAATAPVELPRNQPNDGPSSSRNDTGWVVLVQEDYTTATRPVRDLAQRLWREGMGALGVVIGVLTVLWYIVIRVLGDPTATGSRPTSPPGASTPLAAMTTLPAPEAPRNNRQTRQ